MKLKFGLLTIALITFVGFANSQSVIITPKKTVYHRPKPIMDSKRAFTVTYPIVKAATPLLSKKIEAAISYARVLQLDLKDEINESQWLEEADFEVNYNAKGILVITLWISGSGAYPDGSSKTVAVDLKTGSRITPAIAFREHASLTALVLKKQKLEIEKAIREIRENPDEKDTDPSELFREEMFTSKSLDQFAIDDKGLTFIYEYGFPHVIKALEPEGRYRFTWAEISRFINPASPLARFIVR